MIKNLRYAAFGYAIRLRRAIIGATICRIWGHKWGEWRPFDDDDVARVRVCQRGCGATDFRSAYQGWAEQFVGEMAAALASVSHCLRELAS